MRDDFVDWLLHVKLCITRNAYICVELYMQHFTHHKFLGKKTEYESPSKEVLMHFKLTR